MKKTIKIFFKNKKEYSFHKTKQIPQSVKKNTSIFWKILRKDDLVRNNISHQSVPHIYALKNSV